MRAQPEKLLTDAQDCALIRLRAADRLWLARQGDRVEVIIAPLVQK
jgi:hypothetical protein